MDFIIRSARVEDAEGIFNTHKRSITEIVAKDYNPEQISAWFPAERTPDYYADIIANHTREYIVAELNHSIAGVARIEGNYINIFYVHPDFTGKGIGKALFDYIESEIKNNGYNCIVLNSTITANQFYQKMGMVILEQSKYRFDNDIEVDIFKMEKSLDQK